MPRFIVRDAERAAISDLLHSAHERLSVLVFEGEAGIGKTTMWREAVREAEASGFRVLACRAAQAETKLGLAALADLLRDVDDDALAPLPDPQRFALEVALLRSSPRVAPPNPRAVGTAVVSLLSSLAADRPLVVAIDDVQWLDRASVGVLSFAIRRLDERPIGILVSERLDGAQAGDLLGLADLATERSHRIRLGPLNISALYHVIQGELGLVYPRPTLQRIERASGGNPFYAIELARALDGRRLNPGEPLPVPDTVAGLLHARIKVLPALAQEALLAVALLSDPTVSAVEEALERTALDLLELGVDSGLLELRRDRVRFAHPLLAEAVSSFVSAERMRSMNRRLADVVESEEQAARHLALASEEPDEGVAARLEEAARLAGRRGAHESAAELLELARRLTPVGAARRERELALALALFRSGETAAATELLDSLLDGPLEGVARARALEQRAHIYWVDGTAEEAAACCREALEHVGSDVALRARILVTLSRVTYDISTGEKHARAAIALLDSLEDPDPSVLAEAVTALAESEFYLRGGVSPSVVERGLELERIAPAEQVSDRFSASLGVWLKYLGDFDGARRWLEHTRRAAIEEGDESSLPYALSHLPQLDLWTGDWDESERLALEHLTLAERNGQTGERFTAIYSLSAVHAHRGKIEETLALVDGVIEEAERSDPWYLYQLLSVLGFLELSRDRAHEAVAALGKAYEIYVESGAGSPSWVFENYPEALIRVGELDKAASVVASYEARARAAGAALNLAPARRCSALLAAARKDLVAAETAVQESLALHEGAAAPFSRARTLVVAGQIRRRRGERRAAQEALEEAVTIFDELGAVLWAERARSELARVPIKRRSGDGLTAAETRVAALVAEGKTNEEIAQTLFVTKKTVEANLTRIYRKLGVRSRTALAARLAATPIEVTSAEM